MPKVDLEKLKREDLEEAKMGIPPRFGKDIDVDFTLENSGRWEKVKGGNVWKLEVYSENSHSINMIFNDFFLAEGSELIIYNKEMNMMAGPITSFSNNKSRKFSTDIIIGQSVILEF
ncbi:putative lysyl endopeptidase precursor [Lunatimonas lonarensis]|uniref:Putative lysyl endopeptidase n=2 Tax=Lunatimonas lonarensis TaxID=1232681 RepID=R7ZYQ4_9BACT|nr:putative lysyl endopeptidase precursor [Lunatimonas lonarensis]